MKSKKITKRTTSKTKYRSEGLAARERKRASVDDRRAENAFGNTVPAVTGRLDCKGDRFGFVTAEDGDLFISGANLFGARHGDTVRAVVLGNRPFRGGARREGRVVEIVERNSLSVVATVVFRDNLFYAVPDDRHYGELLEIIEPGGAKEHDKAVIDIVPTKNGDCARVLAVLGRFDEIGMDVKSVVVAHKLRTEFSRDVLDQADRCADVTEADIAPDRADFRDSVVFTIDGSDSKDFDDAVSLVRTENGYRLGVYIADVTHYVAEGSPLDREAMLRGTSVYLADRVIPMLPEALSNGVCSLNPLATRLVLAVIIELDGNGMPISSVVREGVIRSCARMTYTGVQAILDGNAMLRRKYANILPTLELMKELAAKRAAIRRRGGAVEFDLTETEIKFDESGHVVDIAKKPRLFSMSMIEEFMILANCAVAEKFCKLKVPFVYRAHERPDPEKISALNEFLAAAGEDAQCPLDPTPKQVAKLLASVKPEISAAVSHVALRAMAKATYEPTNCGHFGLAEKHYCHFTSPIRRYPDLAIHRIIKAVLHGGAAAARKYKSFAADAAERSSKAERVAQECERQVDDLKKAEYMSRHIGERYSGVISSVTEFGFFVELDNSAEGLVRMQSLPPAARFDSRSLSIVCGRARFRLGDRADIIVKKVEGDRVDFVLG